MNEEDRAQWGAVVPKKHTHTHTYIYIYIERETIAPKLQTCTASYSAEYYRQL